MSQVFDNQFGFKYLCLPRFLRFVMNFNEFRYGFKNYNLVEPCFNMIWPFALYGLLDALVCVFEFFFFGCVLPDF